MSRSVVVEKNRDKAWLHKIENFSYDPVFIMGLHRSGTTLLYELMGMTGLFNILTAYHVLCYDDLLANHFEGRALEERQKLNDWFASLNMKTRLIDNVKLNADMPEEYGMILHSKGHPMHVTKTGFADFEQICRKIQITSDLNKVLLLKNPWDFDVFLFLKKMMPQAKFIFIHRHPFHVLNSQLKALHANWSRVNPYVARLSKTYSRIHATPFLKEIFRMATDPSVKIPLIQLWMSIKIASSMKTYIRNIDSLPLSSYMSLRYEDLCANPSPIFRSIYEFCGVDPQNDLPFEKHIQPRPVKLLPALTNNFQALRKRFAEGMTYHGYAE